MIGNLRGCHNGPIVAISVHAMNAYPHHPTVSLLDRKTPCFAANPACIQGFSI